MATVVPIFDEADGFMGVWAQNRSFNPSPGTLAELMGLAEPTLIALTKGPHTRTENYGLMRVGSNVSFQDGVFLMLDGESTPIEDVKAGRSFVAVAYHGIPIVQRTEKPLEKPPLKSGSTGRKKWWRFWEFLGGHQPTDEDLRTIQVGMPVEKVVQIAGRCKNITTMASALGQMKGFVASGEALAKMNATELWVYTTAQGKYKFFVTNRTVEEVKFEKMG